MAFNIVEVDGVPAKNSKLPVSSIIKDHTTDNEAGVTDAHRLLVDTGLDNGTFIYRVSAPIMNTFHGFDHDKVTFVCNKNEFTEFKSYTFLAGKFVKEVFVAVSRKDIELQISIDGIVHNEMSLSECYDMLVSSTGAMTGDYFGIFKNSANNFTVKLGFDNTPITTDLKIKIKYDGNQPTGSVDLNSVITIYNEEVVTP